jgi:hypothetical protein
VIAVGKARDLTGEKFNRLTCIRKLDYKHPKGGFMWLCECDCGNTVELPTYRITSGEIPSCGCQKKEGQRKSRNVKPKISFAKFCERLEGAYSYYCEDWKGVIGSDVVVSCAKHGSSTRKSDVIRQSTYPCIKCANESRALNKTNSYDDVLEKFKEVHGEKYIYPKSNIKLYENQYSTIKVICPKHGEFDKHVQKHLSGQGCFECRVEEMIEEKVLIGGYSERVFEDNPDIANSDGLIYYLKIGNLYKIGITRQALNDRLKCIRYESKLPIKVLDTKIMPLIECYRLEQEILDRYKDNRIRTDWSTEMFDKDILDGKIKIGVMLNDKY